MARNPYIDKSTNNHNLWLFIMGLLQLLGLASLLHAGYSSYEFTHLQKSHSIDLPFPKDITLEVILSLVILTVDLFLQKPPSRLSLIDEDVIKSEYKLKPILMKDAVVEDEKLGAGPFKFVETRPTFIDVVAKRKEFAEWAGDQEDNEEKKEGLKKELQGYLTPESKKSDDKSGEKIEEKIEETEKVEPIHEEPKVEQKSTKKNTKKTNKKSKKV